MPRRFVNELQSLYSNGATPNLLVGVAFVESSCRQFTNIQNPTLNIMGYGPLESMSGNFVGMMQVPPSQSTLFDWISNATSGRSIFGTKLSDAANYSAQQTAAHPTLPALTATQQEDEALWQYAGFGSSGHYYLPDATFTGWMTTTANPSGVAYAQNVRNHAGTGCAY